jgi:DNA (cytosine-5)-methyltransferase 1
MTHGSLFSGIGGFDLAAEWMGWENLFHCEFNPFCQRILKYYWPNSKSYGDITKSTFTEFRGRIDILTGGFPCQPFSTAGKRKGTDDSRYLWPEMLRVIREVQPRYIVGENVRGLVSWDGGLVFDTVCSDLEAEGYEVLPVLLPAAAVNAPHKRDRIWFIAHANHKGGSSGLGQVQSENGEISERNNDAEFSDSSNGNASDTERIGLHRQAYKQELERTRGSELHIRESRNQGNASDTDCIRLEQCENRTEVERGQGKVCRAGCESTNAIKTNGKIPNASDTDGIGLRRQSDRVGKSEFVSKNEPGNYWANFPTVSPICNGDDELSDRLDSITFPKWRNESIKGGGNAIVPQVALEIFKVIDKLNK